MRNYIILSLAVLLLGGVGCSWINPNPDTGDNTAPDQSSNNEVMLNKVKNSAYNNLNLETATKFGDTTEPQEVVFYMGQGWMGGMGSYPVLEAPGELKRLNDFAIYIEDSQAKALIQDAGGLPACFSGNPIIKVAAKVRMSLKTDRNYSIPDAPEQSYYVATIDELYNVFLKADVCKD